MCLSTGANPNARATRPLDDPGGVKFDLQLPGIEEPSPPALARLISEIWTRSASISSTTMASSSSLRESNNCICASLLVAESGPERGIIMTRSRSSYTTSFDPLRSCCLITCFRRSVSCVSMLFNSSMSSWIRLTDSTSITRTSTGGSADSNFSYCSRHCASFCLKWSSISLICWTNASCFSADSTFSTCHSIVGASTVCSQYTTSTCVGVPSTRFRRNCRFSSWISLISRRRISTRFGLLKSVEPDLLDLVDCAASWPLKVSAFCVCSSSSSRRIAPRL
mmetsp:Transcript_65018/g.172110  ORF Transcript_65018/g.172110 Transcript_65018/m.172110 type:complete len:280 (-) Transcript_65018:335-1174(-)